MVSCGNLSFGQVYELLISIIWQDAALIIADEQGISITKEDLRRIYEEGDIRFNHFRLGEDSSIIKLVHNFFQLLEGPITEQKKRKPLISKDNSPPEHDGYKLSNFVRLQIIMPLCEVFQNALVSLTPYEKQTKDIVLLLLYQHLLSLDKKLHDGNFKKSVLRLWDDTYKAIFDEAIEKTAKNKDDFIKKINPLKDIDPNKQSAFKQAFTRYYEGKVKLTWSKLKPILDFLNSKGEKDLVHRFISLYLLKNTERALKKICNVDIDQVKKDVRLWAQNELPSEPQSEYQRYLMIEEKYNPSDLTLVQRNFIDPDFLEQQEAIQVCGQYLWGKTAIKPYIAKRLIQILEEEICPHCGMFFGNWAKARLDVLSCKFDGSEEDKKLQNGALEYYHTAFDKGRNFAGVYMKAFMEESIAATVYFNRRETKDIPKVIDPKNLLKTPITDDDIKKKDSEKQDNKYGAKQYYEYGYALKLFEEEVSETYFLHFHAEEHFWKVFSACQFTHTEAATQRHSQDMLKANGIYFTSSNTNDPEKVDEWIASIKHTKKLWTITKDGINKVQMSIQRDHNIKYTPLSFALCTRQIDIAEHYLEYFSDSLDVTKINTHGSTALLEALTQYKHCRFSGQSNQETEGYKRIIMELINRSSVDSLYAETVKSHISVLQEAIDTFDLDIVQAIVEKKGFDINQRDKKEFKISADELSPLYYAVLRLRFVDEAHSTGRIDSTNGNITWKNLNVHGMFHEDKQQYLETIESDILFNRVKDLFLPLSIGVKSVWKDEIGEIKEIIKYLTGKTKDVDAFRKQAPTGESTSVLDLAVKCDFPDICRLLIDKGANPARVIGKNSIAYDSPFISAAWFKSWKTLEMLLLDFKERIKPIINERYREEQQTAAHLLFKVDMAPFYKYSINNENLKFIECFIPLFRNAGAEFDIPDNYNKTVRQILKEHNTEI